MIAAPEKEIVEQVSAPRAGLLPPFGGLFKVACLVNGPIVAALLIFGRIHLALSEMAGFLISVLVCGILYLMVGRGMAHYVESVGGQGGSPATGAAMVQMAALLLGKFVVLGAAAYAVMSVRGIILPAVLAGFLVTHTAIIASASQQMKKR